MAPPRGKTKAGPKRLSSLNSFQPTLSFASSSSSPSGGSLPSRLPSRTKSSDLMPPPPVPKRDTQSEPSSSRHQFSAKGKGRAYDDDIEIISSGDDDVSPKKRSRSKTTAAEPTHAMWTDLYAPDCTVSPSEEDIDVQEDLAPGKARIAKLRDWLRESIYGSRLEDSRNLSRKYKRILLVTGPAGIGKTTSVRVVAEELGVELVEWSEGVEDRNIGVGYETESSITKFSAFLARHAYPPLNLEMGSLSQPASKRPRALLMTSLPNIGHLSTRELFHAALLSFCKTYNSSSCPLIIVHSDSGSGGRAEESWMDRERGGNEGPLEVVGREVKDGPWCNEIEFLPLAQTFLTKALTRVLSLAISDPDMRPSLGAVQLIGMSANGDLRSAINSLQVLCSGDQFKKAKRSKKSDAKRGKATGRGSRGGRGAKVDVSEEIRAALDAVTRREQSLNLFHALGKVLYNKRLDDPSQEKEDIEIIEATRRLPEEDELPSQLQEFERRRSLIRMEEYLPTIPVDASTFALWIHHNIPQFCDAVEQSSAILDDFCAADLMRTDDDIWQSSPQAIAYALHLYVRGALMGLPSPVQRHNQKVVKPQFFDSFRSEKESASLLDAATEYMSKKAIAASVAFANGDDLDGPPWGGIMSRGVLAMEMVPMALKIQSLTHHNVLPPSVEALSLQVENGLYYGGTELEPRDNGGEADFDAEAAGEDGMGVPEVHRWKDDEPEREQVGWLEDDDIEDWDSE